MYEDQRLEDIEVEDVRGYEDLDYSTYKVGKFFLFRKMRIRLNKPARVYVKLKGAGVLTFDIGKGLTSDGGSIPWGFGWVISRWSPLALLICYILHDLFFASKLFSFEFSNAVFKALLIYMSGRANINMTQVRVVATAVGSKIGRACYDDVDSYDEENKKLINITWSAI